MKKLFIVCFLLLGIRANAQSNLGCYYDSLMSLMICGNLSIQGDPNNICDDGVHLWVQYTPNSTVPFSSTLMQEAFGSTDSYKVVQSSYIFEPQTNPISANIFTDDIWSQVINLPFKFCFFENKYDQLVIGANGQISFDISQAGLYNNWNTVGWSPLPFSNSSVNNCIFSPFHDIYPTAGGTITYSTEGVAPCRKFIITWNAVPMYSCTNLLASQQIVLTEGSYRIDINVANKPLCAAWNSGNAYLGIQNANATIAFTPPAYNGGQWNASNESWSFIPIGNNNLGTTPTSLTQGLYWVDSFSNNIIGFGDTLHYWPQTDTTIYVFWGDTTLLNDTCFVGNIDTCVNSCGKGYTCNSSNPYIRLTYLKPLANFTDSMVSTCSGADVQFTNLSSMASSYLWLFGDGSSDTSFSPQHTYLGAGPFNVSLIAYGWTCSDTMTMTITPTLVPVLASFTLSADSVCGAVLVTSNNTSVGSNLQYTWFMGDGTSYSTFNIMHAYAAPGLYTVILQISDTINNCKDTAFATIYVDSDTAAKMSVTPTDLCIGDKIYLKCELPNNVLNYSYTFFDGEVVSNTNNFDKRIDSTGNLWVEIKTDYPVCASQSVIEYFKVDDYPIVKLVGKDIICSGRETVTITDENNPTANYEWSTGATTNFIEVLRPDLYKVTVSYGVCKTTAEKNIAPDLECVFIPNAFTPNGDGRNDYFHPIWFDVNDIGSYQILVFNRFGQRVYESGDKNDKGWDGRFKGAACPSETYMYIVNLVSNQGTRKTLKGDVVLIR